MYIVHPNAKVTDRLIRERYIWSILYEDVASWMNNCIDCQKFQISRHVKHTPAHFAALDDRFDNIRIDIIILLIYDGYRHCLTIIDRFSRWPKAIPLRNITTRTVTRDFYVNWVARFAAPRITTTNQGSHSESQLFLFCSHSLVAVAFIRRHTIQRLTASLSTDTRTG